MMIKRIFVVLAVVVLTFCITYFTNTYFLEARDTISLIPLLSIYVFNAVSCAIIYILVELVLKSLPNSAGYAYMALMMVKLGLLLLIFKNSLFPEQPLSKIDKLSLLIPFFVFLIIEAIFIGKLLNNKLYK